ncbi:hypothetical protein [Frankia sp. AgB32]|uniref:hypothetical protein n=1 Tax=Frankia sp. AgB32 TaxID=631119 RepID=UPI002010A3EE|nr:hypothetical protein [Frankia sp. AgB32]MCK9893516.1 hypothetical protein [Frankia sp. AgB32]
MIERATVRVPVAGAPETDVDVDAVGRLVAGLDLGPDLGGPVLLGVGHSMGAMLVAYQQARRRPYAGVALLGYSGRACPTC